MFAAWSVPQGLGSIDGHGIVATVNQLVERHIVGVSRPPGHPTTEFYVFGGLAWLLRFVGDRVFTPSVFLVLQGATAVAVAVVFYEWLLRIGLSVSRAALGVFCLLGSPQFLKQAVDGEEFLAALLLLLLAVRVLSPYASDSRASRFYLSIALFAAATGCRPEFGLFGLLYYIAFARYFRLGAGKIFGAAVVAAGALAIVWGPVICTVGIVPPYDDGVDAHRRVALWGYKLLFHAFGFPAGLLLLGVLVTTIVRFRSRMKGSVAGFECMIAPWVTGAFCLLFLAYPTKPAFLLVTLPCLILLVLRSHNLLCLVLAGVTAMGGLVGLDIVRDRQIEPLHVTPGAIRQAIAGKPADRMDYLGRLAENSRAKTVVIGDAWHWDFDYAVAHGNVRLQPCTQDFAQNTFVLNAESTRLLLPRDYLWDQALLRRLRDRGFVFVMDRLLWRTLYARYELSQPNTDFVSIDDIAVHLIDVRPP